ncbi:hypothetical protein L484_006296 [Morus notabilis]|uniref:Uncharacterized protein n=1 Tax=Morus notabilis TaxID=981085 RepID=W9R3L3_9ROSA|nr:hypothetical protein L484_006296 [Morus notabilis]
MSIVGFGLASAESHVILPHSTVGSPPQCLYRTHGWTRSNEYSPAKRPPMKDPKSPPSLSPFSVGFADELKNARRVGSFKQFMVGRSSEATFSDVFEKQEAIIRYLGGFDATVEIETLLGQADKLEESSAVAATSN